MKPIYFIALMLLLFAFSCKRIDVTRITKIETLDVTFANNQLIAKGNLIDASDNGIGNYGFCIALHPGPNINDLVYSVGNSKNLGNYSAIIQSVLANKTYYVRTFAISASGKEYTYGETKSIITTPSSFNLLIDTLSIENSHLIFLRGIISGVGSLNIINYGFCWALKPNPTRFDFHAQNASLVSNTLFYEDITDFNLDTTYHFKAYAVLTDSTTIYSTEKTVIVPSLKIQTDSLIKQGSNVLLYGRFKNAGVDPIQEYGFCWSTNNTLPNINDNKIAFSNLTSLNFNSSIPLVNGSTYYVRAYTIVNAKIIYGNVISKAF